MFFHGYGDLGMILGLIVKNVGLALGSKGLKVGLSLSSSIFTTNAYRY